MSEIALARIKSFGSAQQADYVPEKNTVLELTAQALQGIIDQATKPLLERIAALEKSQDLIYQNQDIQFNLICQLKEKKDLKTGNQKDKADILKALLAANGGKMLTKDAWRKMGMAKSSFSELVKRCDFIEIRKSKLDARMHLLVLTSKFVHER